MKLVRDFASEFPYLALAILIPLVPLIIVADIVMFFWRRIR